MGTLSRWIPGVQKLTPVLTLGCDALRALEIRAKHSIAQWWPQRWPKGDPWAEHAHWSSHTFSADQWACMATALEFAANDGQSGIVDEASDLLPLMPFGPWHWSGQEF